MVAPSALAETVTPPSFSPVAAVIDPLSSASAACADSGMSAVAANPAAAMAAKVKLLACLISISFWGRSDQRAAGAGGFGAGTVFKYATIALIWVGSN